MPRVQRLRGGQEAMSSILVLETDGQGPGQKLLFEQHEYFLDTSRFPSLSSGDTGGRIILSPSPGPHRMAGQISRSSSWTTLSRCPWNMPSSPWRQVGLEWALGYGITVHSSQGLTTADPQKVWMIDDYLQWSNLAFLVSRVEHLNQLEQVVCPLRSVPVRHAASPPRSQHSSIAKSSRGSWWPRTRLKGCDLGGPEAQGRSYLSTKGGLIQPLCGVQHWAALRLPAKGNTAVQCWLARQYHRPHLR